MALGLATNPENLTAARAEGVLGLKLNRRLAFSDSAKKEAE
jgi:hypothetical protein